MPSYPNDFLDRLTAVSGAYSYSYAYNQIGNVTSMNGSNYTYGQDDAGPHAATTVGGTSYTYDDNGNMTARGSHTLTWNIENQLASYYDGSTTTTYVYDGNGQRGKKTVGGTTTLYVNKYYEKTGDAVTTNYYLGGRLVAQREGTTLRYIHQDHLTGTSVATASDGSSLGSIKYYPWGVTRSGSVPTDKKFTGQRLDGTGLYYYGARYYDPVIGRFISADTFVQAAANFNIISSPLTVNIVPAGLGTVLGPRAAHPLSFTIAPPNPQALNRYTYVFNVPLRYTDPEGWWTFGFGFQIGGGAGGGVGFAILFVIDLEGNVGVLWSAGGGGYGGVSGSGGVQFQTTSANTINDLEGVSTQVGGSTELPNVAIGRAGVSVGGELVTGPAKSGGSYTGVNVNIGVGGGLGPAELHGNVEKSGFWWKTGPTSASNTWFPDPNNRNEQGRLIYTNPEDEEAARGLGLL
ncbi:MAG: RHS repeat-associated core domain-containing protein [Chloroflexota bacterium]